MVALQPFHFIDKIRTKCGFLYFSLFTVHCSLSKTGGF